MVELTILEDTEAVAKDTEAVAKDTEAVAKDTEAVAKHIQRLYASQRSAPILKKSGQSRGRSGQKLCPDPIFSL
jgi:hypothetical protein